MLEFVLEAALALLLESSRSLGVEEDEASGVGTAVVLAGSRTEEDACVEPGFAEEELLLSVELSESESGL